MTKQTTEIKDIANIDPHLDYQVVIIGAGLSGIYQIKRLADLGVRATVLDANDDLGGTWYNNRYPGARFDSESYTYGYSFSQEVLDEWDWTEKHSAQPETLAYLNYVADKFELRKYMQFGCRVGSMVFYEDTNTWMLRLSDGHEITTRFVVTAVGTLSTPTLPKIEGIASFRGISFHASNWPHEPLDLTGKRVAVIGSGATAIQLIPEVAKAAEQLTVFQRRPNWAAPLNNAPISETEMAEIRERYDEIFATCARSPGGFEHEPDSRSFYDVGPAQRRELWDRLYDEPGFGIWLQNFYEIFVDEKANAEISNYIAERIRQRVNDPMLAERLIPKDHGFGVQRLPLETGYFETYNRANVELVDAVETPIVRVTPGGLETSDRSFEFDVIVYATGFDSFTGALDQIDIQGSGGERLRNKWAAGPVTYLGLMISEFPNFLMLMGPQTAAANFPRAAEMSVDWVTPFLEHMWAQGHQRFDVNETSEAEWVEHVKAMYKGALLRKAKSFFTGYNSNIEGHEYGKTRYNIYNGGVPRYASIVNEVAENDYEGVNFQ
ncbi:MAG: NAD(P)/FAD-dependent oxidoreductase [Gammaproteobacteria bacterium]|jgi:cation diffusion facilitator CzcD-associated flavoprotein CzcO|nr:NAD(P)/FAD-dependent oxidoreductase [Gammaproteobacteria bacterium]